jgi:hypothetical protein
MPVSGGLSGSPPWQRQSGWSPSTSPVGHPPTLPPHPSPSSLADHEDLLPHPSRSGGRHHDDVLPDRRISVRSRPDPRPCDGRQGGTDRRPRVTADPVD